MLDTIPQICVNVNEFKFYYGVEFSDDMELYTYSSWQYYVTQTDSVDAMTTSITQANPIWVGGMASYGGEANLLLGLIMSGMIGDTLLLFPDTLGDMLQYYSVPTYLNGMVAGMVSFGYTEEQVWGQWGYYGLLGAYTFAEYGALTGVTTYDSLTDFEFCGATGYSLSAAQSATLMNSSLPYAMTNADGWDIWMDILTKYGATGDITNSTYFVEVYTALGADDYAMGGALTYMSNLVNSVYYAAVVLSGFGQTYGADCPGFDYLGASQFGGMTVMEIYTGAAGMNSVVYAGLSPALIVAPEYGVWLEEKWVQRTYFADSGLLSAIESYNFIQMLANADYMTEFITYVVAADTVYGAVGATMATGIYADWLTGTCAYASSTAPLGLTCSGYDYTSTGLSASCSSYDTAGSTTCTNWVAFLTFANYIAADLLLKYGYVGEQLASPCFPPSWAAMGAPYDAGCEPVLNADGTGGISGLFISQTIEDYLFGWTDPALGASYATWGTNYSTKADFQAANGVETTTMYTGNGDLSDANKYYSLCHTADPDTSCTERTQFYTRPDFGGSCTTDYDLAASGSADCKAFLAPEVINGQFSTQVPHSASGKRLYDAIEGIFVSEIMRQVNFTYLEDVKVEGVDAFKYVIATESLAGYNAAEDANPANLKYGMPETGVIPMAKLKGGVPAFATVPHFLGAESRFTEMFTGLAPDAATMTTFVSVEPITGKVIDGADILQQALGVDGDGYINGASSTNEYGSIWGSTFYHETNLVIPMWWLTKSRSITADQGTDLQLLLYGSVALAAALFLGLLIPGIICLVIGCGCAAFGGSQVSGGGKKVEPA